VTAAQQHDLAHLSHRELAGHHQQAATPGFERA
jgi:hypothetical protein